MQPRLQVQLRPLTSVQRFIDSRDDSNSRMGPEPEFSKVEYS
jgi:hypothetical protein